MTISRTAFLAAAVALGAASPAAAYSKAAEYLMREQLADACPEGGRFLPEGVIERDLTGDGKPDLVLDHSATECRHHSGRSGWCGVELCDVKIYVRFGDLLREVESFNSVGVTVGGGVRPKIHAISGSGSGNQKYSIRWNGSAFK